jgi:hypothetical protein
VIPLFTSRSSSCRRDLRPATRDPEEWIYYARSEGEFLDRFNFALVELPVFPIDNHTASDPACLNYDQFKSGLKEKVNQAAPNRTGLYRVYTLDFTSDSRQRGRIVGKADK